MRAAVLTLLFLCLVLALPAWCGEEPPAEQAQPKTKADEEPTPAAGPQRTTWEEWISTHAYDPIIRRWVPVPEGVEPGPKTGYIWNHGRWEVVKIIHRKGYGWGYFDERGRWHGQDERRRVYRRVLWKRRDYLNMIPRDTFDEPYIVRTLKLGALEGRRVEELLRSNLIQEVLLDDINGEESVVSFDRRKRALSISGRAELVAKIATIVTDESTFKALTTEQAHGNLVEVISLVDMRFLENDPEPALNIADLNYAGLLRLLKPESPAYRRLHKAVWFNDAFGTVTLIDQPDTIRKVREYLGAMPYAPKPERMTTTGR